MRDQQTDDYRRHELNHNAKASFVCSVCSKGFHRHDLLARHLEKQYVGSCQ